MQNAEKVANVVSKR